MSDASRSLPLPRWLPPVFAVSGFSALVYQVVWQRALFTIYGINIESVTVVVTAFMLGLGLGSLLGGMLSRNPGRPVLLVFALVEAGIGVFGFVSLPLFRLVGGWSLHADPALTALVTFLLLLVPTLLMGATLPLLVAHAVRLTGNVGQSVGNLYFVNTLGSAIAALVTVVAVLALVGQQGAVVFAGVLNCAVGGFVYLRHMGTRREATS